MASQARAVPTPASSKRTARFGLTRACPCSTLLKVTRLTPSRDAASATLKPSSASTSSCRISPGCTGFFITVITSESVVILIVDEFDIALDDPAGEVRTSARTSTTTRDEYRFDRCS